MAYEKHTWVVGEPITQEKMNHIEDGITSASSTAETAASTASGITQVRGDVTTLQGIVGLSISDTNGLQYRVSSLESQASQSNNGDEALSQIETATVNHIPAYDSLNQRLDSIDTSVYEESVLAQALSDSIEQAKRVNVPNDTLKARFEYIDGRVNGLFSGYESLSQALTNAGGTDSQGLTRSLIDRLNAMDKGLVLQSGQNIPDIWNEINTARGVNNLYGSLDGRFNNIEEKIATALESTAYGKTGNNAYTSLDARFEAVEGEVVTARGSEANLDARLDTIESDISGLSSSKVSTNAIANNLTTTTEGKVLDARQGKELEDKKVNYTDIKDNLTSDDADKPLSAKQGKALKGLIDSMDTAYKAADTALDGRLDTVESDLNTASTGLKARMSTAESDIDTIESDLNTATTGLKARMTAAENDIDSLEGIVTTPTTGLVAKVGALETAVNDSTDGLVTRVSTLETDVNHSTNGLAATKAIADEALTKANAAAVASTVNTALGDLDTRLNAIDGGTALTGANTLAQRVTSLENEPKSATEIVSVLPQTGDATKDYLLGPNEDGKYFYYKWIEDSAEDNWKLISGGGSGNGSSSGEFAASISATDIPNPNDTTDYFVGDNTNGYIHYRYVIPEGESVGNFVRILPKNLLANASVNSNGKPIITTIGDENTNVLNNFNALKSVNCVTTYDTDGVTPKSYALSFVDVNGQEYTWDLAAGGGGSSYTVQFINESGNLELYVPNDANSAIISARIYARLGQDLLSQTGEITVKYKTESAAEYTTARVISSVANNTITNIDIIDLLAKDSITNIQLTASIQPEDTPITRNITYTIHRVPMSIEVYNYNPASVKTSNFNFQYYCIGTNLSKTVHFVIDNVETTENIGINANTDLLTKQINVSSLSRGMHSLKVYFTVGTYSSNEINTYFLYDDGTQENKPIIALSTNKATIQDGENLNLNYTVYTKGLPNTEEVTLETYTMVDNIKNVYETKSYENIDNSIEHTIPIINYPSSGTFYMTMTAKHTVNNVEYTESKTITVTITEYQSAYDSQMARAGTANLIYEYDAAGRTNNDSDKAVYEYEFTSVSGDSETFTGTSSDFNWASNGYVDGSSLLISGGATHTINVPLFLAGTQNVSLETDTNNDDILKNGRTFEIDYEVNTASNLNAEIASFGSGLKITPSVSYLVPQGTTVTVNSHGLIEREDEICAAYLATGKRMHMVFVIEPKSTTPTSQGEYHQCVNIYINGEFVNSCPYALSDNFSTSSTFTIGSNTCIIKLYSVRMYNRGLTNDEVLRNYMMAPITKVDRINRFSANDVLDNNKLVDYNKARNKFNCLLITGEISPYKKTTKTPSGVTLTKPDPVNLTYKTEFNLLDKKGNGTYYSSNNVQGTSSQTYPIHNLKVYLAKEAIDEVTGDPISKKYKYSLKGENGIAESTLCWKADYMSTDHANTFNANFANDLFTDKLPSQVADAKVQNTVYGIRCLLFQRNDENSTPVFVADGCLNNDKGNNSAFGLVDKTYDEAEISEGVTRPLNDTTRQKWEFTNNSSALDFFKADGLLANNNGDFYAKTAFESTYPDEGDLEDNNLQPNYNHLQVLLTWVHQRANFWDADATQTGTVSYNQETGIYTTTGTVYTYNNIPYPSVREYKKAIFKAEFTNHINLNHALTYHLFSEFIALCDNRAKNMFMRCDNVREEIVKDISHNVIFNGNNNPNASFFESTTNIGTQEDPIYAFANADNIDWETGEGHSTFAIWYPVLYDLDSCYGAENVGRITIPYDADWNYAYNGKNQFSGVDSRLWLMVEEAFADELKTLAQTLYPNSLNYNTFYTTQIQAMLDFSCPAMINQDMLLKFNAYWADGFIDYSLPNNPHVYRDYKYIQRGSRAYQKDTFIKLRSNYLSSKYTTSNFMNDQIRFRSSVVIPVSNSGITVTANQTIYPAITYGDNKPAIRSVNKIGPGESVTLQASDQVGNTDTIHIGGASALTDIGDISKFEPYNLDVSGGINLKSLVVGSNSINASTNKIDGLGSCALLETLNVRNCTGFNGTLNLSGNGLIKNVYASGSGITNIELREGGNLTNIEYGALTTTIKIINHNTLQSFVYENSDNNHYANVSKLHIENTPNVPVVDIINYNIANLTGGIRLVGIDIDLFEDASTEEEIEAALEKTTAFLNALVSELARGKYINSAGVFITNSTNYPHITGKVHITSIRASLLAKINEYYPNLIVYNTIDASGTPNNNVITEYTITYKNYDGTLLYTDYRTGQEHYIDPASWNELDIDPITQKPRLWSICPPDGIPKKPEDAQYKYSFGTYSNGTDYDRFSGWMKEDSETTPSADDFVSGNTTFIAQYPTTELQKYTVTWYDGEGGTIVHSYSNINYGIDISNYDQPEDTGAIKRARLVNGQYQVFKGWNRPVGKVTGNINVYAQWETSTIDNATQLTNFDMATLSAADIYALSQLGAQAKIRLLESNLGNNPICIPMGNDFDYTDGVNTTNLLGSSEKFVFTSSTAEAKIYDGAHNIGEVRPLAQNTDWTLAIDFKFLLNQIVYNKGREFVIASCYKEDNGNIQGFKVSLNKSSSTTDTNQPVTVTWGTQSQIIDYVTVDTSVASNNTKQYSKSYRNVLVLRHRASVPDALYVYYIAPNTLVSNNYGRDYGLAITTTTITWSNNTAIDTPLILGGNYIYENGTPRIEGNVGVDSRFPAKGIIYWGKFWDEDLGNKNCRRLAAWPHENEYFYLAGYQNNSDPSRQIIHNTNLNFVSAQAFGDRGFYTRHGWIDSQGVISWSNTYVRQFCNERIFEGLPIKYQSIFADQNGLLAKRTITSNQFIDQTSSSTTTSADYFYLSAEQEVNNQTISDTNKAAETRIGPWPWLKSSTNLTVLVDPYNSGALQEQSSPSINPFRYRFIGKYITPTAKIFYHTEDPYHSGASWTYNNQQIYVQSGDVWITNDGTAYIYYTNTEINEGVYVDIVTAGGGWKKAQIWELRTFDTSRFAGWNQFEKVDDKGELQINQFSSTYGQNDIHLLCPEFSI